MIGNKWCTEAAGVVRLGRRAFHAAQKPYREERWSAWK